MAKYGCQSLAAYYCIYPNYKWDNIFLARRDECPARYCHDPGVSVGVSVGVGVDSLVKVFLVPNNMKTLKDITFIFDILLP